MSHRNETTGALGIAAVGAGLNAVAGVCMLVVEHDRIGWRPIAFSALVLFWVVSRWSP
jgi:hypothetical protein